VKVKEDMQIDLFGREIPVSEAYPTKKYGGRRETIKSCFRKMYGSDITHTCKECAHVVHFRYGNSSFNKCQKIGITHSEASDIKLKDPACSLFEPKSEGDEND